MSSSSGGGSYCNSRGYSAKLRPLKTAAERDKLGLPQPQDTQQEQQ
jgi:hypothetical protein